VPLPTLLSYALVAFTIEFDNEAERRADHRTSRHGGNHKSPWLVSLAMYSNCMRLVDQQGISAADLICGARTAPNLSGMQRWGYLVVDPATKHVRATPAGMQARAVWKPLFASVEVRWAQRFGEKPLGELRRSLVDAIAPLEIDLPQALPILHHGLANTIAVREKATASRAQIGKLPLSALLAKPLLAFALAYERNCELSLALGANLLRLLDERRAPARDLPYRSGIAKEAIANALSVLEKRGYVAIERAGASRVVHLTPKGTDGRDAHQRRLAAVEKGWRERFGAERVDRLRAVLEEITLDGGTLSPRLLEGLTPHPENWRAAVARAAELPHFPMVLHRGGYPDGS
jgi:DNA-binding MarR family transcriptional regulator